MLRLSTLRRATLRPAVFKAMPAPKRREAPGPKASPAVLARFAARLREALQVSITDEQWQAAARAIDRGALHEAERALLGDEHDQQKAAAWAQRFVDALGGTYLDSANDELKRAGSSMQLQLYEKAAKKSKNRFTGVPHSDEIIRSQAAKLVTRISGEQRQAIREALVERYSNAKKPETLVRDLKATIGLDPRRARALRSMEASLKENGATDVSAQVDRYRDRLLQDRAETIARTESVSVENAARVEAWQIALDAGDIPETSEQEWVTTGDPCPYCEEMDGQRVAVGDDFKSTRYGAVSNPPLHPNCYCVVVLRSF